MPCFPQDWCSRIAEPEALARWLLFALEFQLAAENLETVIDPSWNDIGQHEARSSETIWSRNRCLSSIALGIERTARIRWAIGYHFTWHSPYDAASQPYSFPQHVAWEEVTFRHHAGSGRKTEISHRLW